MSEVWLRINAQRELRENVRTSIKEAGLTQSAAANAAGVKYSRLTAALGANVWFHEDEIEALSKVLEVSASELLGDSIYRDDPRRKEFNHRPDWYFEAGESKRRKALQAQLERPREDRLRRALCSVCGTMRRVNQAEIQLADRDDPRVQSVGDGDPGSRWSHKARLAPRAMWPAECATCRAETSHALLNNGDSYGGPDALEKDLPGPSADARAAVERDALLRRLEGFGVEIHWRSLAGKKWRAKHFTPVVGADWDDSKSVWRVEINPEYTATFQLGCLKELWGAIALNKLDWWPTSPEEGVWMAPRDDSTSAAIDGLVEEIHNSAAAVLSSIVLDTEIDGKEAQK